MTLLKLSIDYLIFFTIIKKCFFFSEASILYTKLRFYEKNIMVVTYSDEISVDFKYDEFANIR
jgi:hypothetical protein